MVEPQGRLSFMLRQVGVFLLNSPFVFDRHDHWLRRDDVGVVVLEVEAV